MNPKIDGYLDKLEHWQTELRLLRKIALSCGLVEECKWKHPCYTHKGKNIILLQDFKEYCAIGFLKGVLLKDKEHILVQPTVNIQAARQLRFTNSSEIEQLQAVIKAYILEAIQVEEADLKIKAKTTSEFNVPEELQQQFKENPNLKVAFEQLTEGRKRGYLLYFSQAKQSETRKTRIIKNTARILDGKGLHDCICGLSKRKPNCDGSHKYLPTNENRADS